MKSVIEEMEELIRKNLPEATATTLKKYLEEAEENKRKLKEYDVAHANLKTAEAEKRADAVYKLAEIFFKKPTLVRSTVKTSNGYNGRDNINSNENETVTERWQA